MHTRTLNLPYRSCGVSCRTIQIALGLQYLHQYNILHRDLKTQNIFLTRHKIIKVKPTAPVAREGATRAVLGALVYRYLAR